MLTHKQVDCLHKIITEPPVSCNTGHEKSIELTFRDDDIMLFACFNKERANRIVTAMTGKYVIGLLTLVIIMTAISYILYLCGLLSWDTSEYILGTSYVLYSLYAIAWIPLSNKFALKSLCTSFEFMFKLWYVLVFFVSHFAVEYLEG
eukprot:820959_1